MERNENGREIEKCLFFITKIQKFASECHKNYVLANLEQTQNTFGAWNIKFNLKIIKVESQLSHVTLEIAKYVDAALTVH